MTSATTSEQVLPGVWRWADPEGSDRCGTALLVPPASGASQSGNASGAAEANRPAVILVDPPALPDDARREIERAGPICHVVLTSARLAHLGAPFRATSAAGVEVWAPRPADAAATVDGIDHLVALDCALPGGLLVCQLPEDAAPNGEVAYLWPHAGDGLLLTGDVLTVVGQVPVYVEGDAFSITAFQATVRALLAADPGALAPAHQAPPDRYVNYSTAYAAHIGRPYHARNAAPVEGPRFLVPLAERALAEALVAPVVLRHPTRESAEAQLIPDPFACARCGQPNAPMAQTCGGPMIARLCPECRAERRQHLPAARLMVCAGGCCTREGARAVLSAARQAADEQGIAGEVDVVPVSCLGECSLGPFLLVGDAQNREPQFARAFREESGVRARRYAADEGEIVDEESELVLSRFAALVQPDEAARLVTRLARTIPAANKE